MTASPVEKFQEWRVFQSEIDHHAVELIFTLAAIVKESGPYCPLFDCTGTHNDDNKVIAP